jgi:hypothetical protein
LEKFYGNVNTDAEAPAADVTENYAGKRAYFTVAHLGWSTASVGISKFFTGKRSLR